MTKETAETIALRIKGEKFGNTVSEPLSELLKATITPQDRANIANKTGIGASTVRNLILRTTTITEENSRALYALLDKAIEKYNENIDNSGKAVQQLEALID